jgi:hypothetical protein
MNTQHISNLLSCTSNVQVCASNELKFGEMPFYAVVNSENTQSDGLHWLALAFFKNGSRVKCIYFDSLGGGLHAMVPSIKHFIYLYADDIYLNSNRVQAFSSSVCGLYSTYFIICMQNKTKYRDFLQQFSNDVDLNDQRVFALFYSALKTLGNSKNEGSMMACKALIKGD